MIDQEINKTLVAWLSARMEEKNHIDLVARVREVEAENAELREQTRWRDVREELPPRYVQMVLGQFVWSQAPPVSEIVLVVEGGVFLPAFYIYGDGIWEVTTPTGTSIRRRITANRVTHWQPLPNVPKEQT